MATKDTVSVYNAATGKYGVVSRFVLEHPVYGQNMVEADENDVPCVDCGDEVSPPEGPLVSDADDKKSAKRGKATKEEPSNE